LNKSNPNIEMLEALANDLEPMLDRLVFVGGSVVSLYKELTDDIHDDIRPTYDVDAVIHVESLLEYYEADEKLKSLGFSNCTDKGAPICRYSKGVYLFDLMPDKKEILGFSNQWYSEGLIDPLNTTLPSGLRIKILKLPFYLGSKIEAFLSRGNDDLLMSHDLEDVLSLIRGLQNIETIISGPSHLKKYLKDFFRKQIRTEALVDYIYGDFPTTPQGQKKAYNLVAFLRGL
jgi:hypothetical protein